MYYKKLSQSGRTVFSMNDMAQIWGVRNRDNLKITVNRLFKRGDLKRIQRGLYVLSDDFDEFELAGRLKTPSYLSLGTVLRENNIIFQDQGKLITSVSDNTITKKAGGFTFKYYKIKEEIFLNKKGIILEKRFSRATPERAVCDQIYLFTDFYFDNLENLDFERLREIARIYNKRVISEVEKIIRKYA